MTIVEHCTPTTTSGDPDGPPQYSAVLLSDPSEPGSPDLPAVVITAVGSSFGYRDPLGRMPSDGVDEVAESALTAQAARGLPTIDS